MKTQTSKLIPLAMALAGLRISLSAIQLSQAATWATTGSMTTAREGHTMTMLLNGQVLVAGGDTNGLPIAAELYDPDTGTWKLTGSMNAPHSGYTATLLFSGLVLVAGGDNTPELYEPTTGSWKLTGSMNIPRYDHTATLLSNGLVLVAGGASNGRILRSELYDPATETWSFTTGHLNNYRSQHTATLLPNGQVLVAGGEGDLGSRTSAELYDPVTGTWTPTGDLNTGRNQHSATLLTNGQVLVVGSEVGIPDTELYDPDTGTWTVTGMLHTRRSWGHTATLLPDGKVLVTGGYLGVPNYLFLASAELYDPTTGIWTTTGSMKKGRQAHTATLLPNSQVLVAGGVTNPVNSNGSGPVLASAELYGSPNLTAILLTNATTLWSGAFLFAFTNTGNELQRIWHHEPIRAVHQLDDTGQCHRNLRWLVSIHRYAGD